jgi:3-deoxy-D-manno-octulosonate 8-phosphate phosphatase (KDO 8-P phosphatase)
MDRTLAERCAAIELLVLDVDGVLTDGGIVYGDPGVEWKRFHVRDGSGLKFWQEAGKRVAIISGRTSRVVEMRAAELGISAVAQGAADKLAAYRALTAASGLTAAQACVVGDDVPDLPVLANCGLAVAVADACAEARAAAHYVTQMAGGQGAVREVIELILRCQGEVHECIRACPAPSGSQVRPGRLRCGDVVKHSDYIGRATKSNRRTGSPLRERAGSLSEGCENPSLRSRSRLALFPRSARSA